MKKLTVKQYITSANYRAQAMLRTLRRMIQTAAPKAEEKISYGMPYYSYGGRLAYFAAFRDHVSFFVMGRAQKKFAREIKPYQTGRATLRFPIGTKIPTALIQKLVKERVREIDEQYAKSRYS